MLGISQSALLGSRLCADWSTENQWNFMLGSKDTTMQTVTRKLATVLGTCMVVVVTGLTAARAQDNQIDPTGFVAALNAERAARGLAPVRHDPAAAAIACENNRHQLVRGLGHHVLGGFGQVAAVGASDAKDALARWMAGCPQWGFAHRDILMAPNLVAVGFDCRSGVATASTRQSFAVVPSPQQSPVAIQPVYVWMYPQYGWGHRAQRWHRGWRW